MNEKTLYRAVVVVVNPNETEMHGFKGYCFATDESEARYHVEKGLTLPGCDLVVTIHPSEEGDEEKWKADGAHPVMLWPQGIHDYESGRRIDN